MFWFSSIPSPISPTVWNIVWLFDLATLNEFVIKILCFCYLTVLHNQNYGSCLRNFLIQPGSSDSTSPTPLNIWEIAWPFHPHLPKFVLEILIDFVTMLCHNSVFVWQIVFWFNLVQPLHPHWLFATLCGHLIRPLRSLV